MSNVLIYWRDYRQNRNGQAARDLEMRWRTNARLFAELKAVDGKSKNCQLLHDHAVWFVNSR